MAVNKVEYAGRVLVDLSGDSVAPETLLMGNTAHGADGEVITGTAPVLYVQTDEPPESAPDESYWLNMDGEGGGMIFPDAECRAAFIARMNEKAVEIGMTNTNYNDPTGRTNTSTAKDIARCLLHATGYEKMHEIWNTPSRDVKCISADGTVRIQKAISSVVSNTASSQLTNYYNVMGGKTGTLSSNPIYNLASVCQSKKNPMDWYAIAVVDADTNNDGSGNRFAATKQTMDYIESREGEDVQDPTALLDEIAWDTLTYRDIFISNNLAPDINGNSMTSATGITYADSAGSTSIVKNEGAEANYAPPYSLYVSGTTSQQARSSIQYQSGTELFVAANVKVTDYTKGYAGVIFGSAYTSAVSAKTNGYQVASDIVSFTSTTGANYRIFIGSASSANLTAYINNPVAVNMNIFENAPTADELRELYINYTAILTAIYEAQGATDSGEGAEINPPASNICAFKVPYHNARALKNSALTPVYSKNASASIRPASTTKIMTAMLAMDYVPDLHEKVTLIQEDIDALNGAGWYASDVLLGESVTYEDLIYLMMLPSSNVSTEMISRAVGAKILKSQNV